MQKLTLIFFITCLILISSYNLSYANNLVISGTTITARDAVNSLLTVQFDISWNNSWKNTRNHDAAWVFFKVYNVTDDEYKHIFLKTTSATKSGGSVSKFYVDPSGFDAGTGTDLEILVPGGNSGCFIRRVDPGSGTVDTENVEVVLRYDALGIDTLDTIQIHPYGIEMVNIPEGAYHLGDNGSSIGSIKGLANENSTSCNDNTQVNLEDKYFTATDRTCTCLMIQTYYNNNSNVNSLCYNVDICPSEGIPLCAAGNFYWASSSATAYYSYYMMKYEMSQGQYRDFLNTLTREQQITRVRTDISGTSVPAADYVMCNNAAVQYGQGIKVTSVGGDAVTPATFICDLDDNGAELATTADAGGRWRAMNYLKWQDLCAYLDWACLRPMNEFEYEKACRGTEEPVNSEYAWGTNTLTQAQGPVVNAGRYNETATTTIGQGLVNYNSVGTDTNVPLRVGFAATGSTNRSGAAASYYGVMNLSDNVREMVAPIDYLASAMLDHDSQGDGTLVLDNYAHIGKTSNTNLLNEICNSNWNYVGLSSDCGNMAPGDEGVFYNITPNMNKYAFVNTPCSQITFGDCRSSCNSFQSNCLGLWNNTWPGVTLQWNFYLYANIYDNNVAQSSSCCVWFGFANFDGSYTCAYIADQVDETPAWYVDKINCRPCELMGQGVARDQRYPFIYADTLDGAETELRVYSFYAELVGSTQAGDATGANWPGTLLDCYDGVNCDGIARSKGASFSDGSGKTVSFRDSGDLGSTGTYRHGGRGVRGFKGALIET